MAFRLERFYQNQGAGFYQNQGAGRPIDSQSRPTPVQNIEQNRENQYRELSNGTQKVRSINSKTKAIEDEEVEETIFDKIINDKPSTKKLREILKDHIEELEEINDNR